MMTNSHMRVKRREGAKPTLKPVSLLTPIFPTHTRFLRNVEEVMSYEPSWFIWLDFFHQEFKRKRTQLKHCPFVCSDLM